MDVIKKINHLKIIVYYSVDDNYVNDFLYGQIIKFNNHEL
jgi:hypothetical protein